MSSQCPLPALQQLGGAFLFVALRQDDGPSALNQAVCPAAET